MDQEEVLDETTGGSDGGAQRWSRSSGSSEVAWVHTSDTLEYPSDVKRFSLTEEVFIELTPWPEASRPEGEEPDEKPAGGDGPSCPPDVCLRPPAPPAPQDPPAEAEAEARGLSPGVPEASPGPARRGGDGELAEVCVFGPEGLAGPGAESRPLLEESALAQLGGQGGEEPGGQGRLRACACCTRAKLKTVAAMAAALVLYPCLLYGAYVFLPFDVPILPDLSSRALYTLRCSVFATIPIVLGLMVYGLAKLFSPSDQPLSKAQAQVQLHRRFVRDSVHLFLLFFVNLMLMATFLPQEALKLVPLLTAFFALARLVYWLAAAFSSRLRGFGYGLSFFPIVGLLVTNLTFVFLLEQHQLISVSPASQGDTDTPRQRFWG